MTRRSPRDLSIHAEQGSPALTRAETSANVCLVPPISVAGVRLAPPSGYVAKMIVLTGPKERAGKQELPYRRNIVVSHEEIAEGTSAEQFAQTQLAVLAKNMQGFKTARTSAIEIGGQTCPLIEAQAHGPAGLLYGQLITYFVRGTDAWTLSASHVFGPQFEAAREEYAAIFGSFEV